MASESENFWQAVEKIENSTGPVGALFFIVIIGSIWAGSVFLAAWAVSATLGTSYWMTFLSIAALKFALK